MAETSGGLVKSSIQFRRDQRDWLKAQSVKRGQPGIEAGIAAIVRDAVDAAMNAEARETAGALQ